MDNFCYLAADEKTKEGAVIDPGFDAEKILAAAEKEGIRIQKILLTHTHYDHITNVPKIVQKTNASISVHALEAGVIKKNNPSFVIVELEENDTFLIGTMPVQVIHTPGHTPGAVCYLIENKLFTGDTLFVGTIGRTDLPGANPADMEKSLGKLAALDEKIEVYPGHDYGSTPVSTIGREKKENPFMQ